MEEEAHSLLLAVSEYILSNDPISSMETIIADVLRKIFNANIVGFHVRTVEKRNQLETYFSVSRKHGDTVVEEPALESLCGGGLDVAFLLVRIVLLVNHPSQPRRILFADEPMKNVSPDKRDLAIALIRQIAEEFDIQIIMTTHEEHYIGNADRVIRFELKGDATHAEAVED